MPRYDAGKQFSLNDLPSVILAGNADEYGDINYADLIEASNKVTDVTKAELQALIVDAALVVGRFYRVTNAVTTQMIVQAVDTITLSKFGVDNSGNIYTYVLSTDTATPIYNIALGTANQILGVNDAADGQEYKTLNSSDDTITFDNSANEIDIKVNRNVLNNSLVLSRLEGFNIIPHRGVIEWGAPENSLISLYHAYLAGAKAIEFDVNYTSDGVLVLLHDDSLNSQFTNSDGSPIVGTVNINDITYAQALTYIRSSTTNGYKIPITTLDDFLRDCAKYNIIPFPELKGTFPQNLDATFIATTRKYFRDENIMLQSFVKEVIIRINEQASYYPVLNGETIANAAALSGAIFVDKSTVNSTLINNAIAAKVPVFAYTVNSQSEIDSLIELGVTLIVSDNSALIVNKNTTYVDSYESGLSFTDATVTSGTVDTGESLVTLNNAGTIQTPSVACSTFGIINADIMVNGLCTVQLYIGGTLYDTITNTSTTANTIAIRRLINLSNSFYIKVTATAANCKVISLNVNSTTFQNTQANRKFLASVRADSGFGIGFDAPSGKEVLNSGATTPALATWDSGGFGRKFAFNENTFIDSILAMASDTGAHKGTYVARKSRGTLAVPTTVVNADVVGTFLGSAYDGGAFRNNASFEFIVDGVVSSGTVPMAIVFNTGTTTRTERGRINSAGRFLLNTTTDNGELMQINGSSRFVGAMGITGAVALVGNLGITGSITSTGQNTITKSAGGAYLRADGATTNAAYHVINNTGGNYLLGVASSTGGGLFGSNASAYAMGFCAESARDMFLGTTNAVRVGVFSTGEVNIGSATARPSASALFSVTSTTQGALLPRMTTTQKNAISSPIEGLEVYDSTLKKKCFYNGSAWETITSA